MSLIHGLILLFLPPYPTPGSWRPRGTWFEEDAATYTFTDTDGDGTIDELELREFLVKKRKEGVLRKDIDTRVTSLMHK